MSVFFNGRLLVTPTVESAIYDYGMATFTDPAAKGADGGIQLWIIAGGGAEINGDIHGVDPFVGFYFSKGDGPNKLRILAAN